MVRLTSLTNTASKARVDLVQMFEPVRADLDAVEREFERQVQSKVGVIPEIGRYIQYGVSPRAAIFWTMAAKAHAFLQQRGFIIPDDIKLVAPDILRHRIIRTYEADAENVSTEDLIQQILVRVPIP